MKSLFWGSCVLVFIISNRDAGAQEVKIHHGFLFFAGETYTVDEQTFGIYEDGHEFAKLIGENKEALDYFHSYRSWHTTAYVMVGFSCAAIVFGGVVFMPGMDKHISSDVGLYSFASAGGFLALGFVFEFVAWGKISSAAEIYNKGLFDDGTGALDIDMKPTLAFSPLDQGGVLTLAWRF